MIGVLVGNDAKETKYGNTKGGKEKRSLQKGCLKINKAGKKSREPEVVALQNYTKKCKPMLVVRAKIAKNRSIFIKVFKIPSVYASKNPGAAFPQIRTRMFTTFQTRGVRKVIHYCSHGHDVRSLNWHHLTSCLQQGSSLMRLAMIFFGIFWLPLEKVLLGCWMVAANAMSEGHGVAV